MFGPAPADDLLAFLAEEGHVRQADDGRWYWSSENFPASEISLRTAAPENVVIIDTTPDRPRVLGEVDLFSAQVLVHERAIYIHESVQYYVDRLEWDERKAYVHRVDVDHYTYANRAVTLKPLEVFAEAPATGGRRIHGEVMVASLVTLFKKLKFLTDENVGWGPIDLPELELQTTAYWLTADASRDALATRRARRRAARGRAGDPDGRVGPADGRSARPRARHPGPLAARGAADDLPVRGGARRDRPLGAPVGAPRRAARRQRPSSSRRAAATAAVRPAPARGSSPRSMRGRSPSGCSAELGARPVTGSPPWRRRRDGTDDRRRRDLARRLERFRAARPRSPPSRATDPAAPRPDRRRPSSRSGWRRRVDGEVVVRAAGPVRPRARRRRGRDRRSTGERLAGAARPAAAGRPARLPRHGDDRARDGGRDGRVPRSAWAGGRATRSARSSCCCRTTPTKRALLDRARAPHPARRLARHVQRPRVRLAAARDALPAGPAGGAAARRPPRPAADRPPPVPSPDGRRAAPDRGDGAARARSGTATSTAGRSPAATSASCAADRPSRCSPSSATTTRTSARWPACSPSWTVATRRRRARRTRRSGDLAGLARAFARARRLDEALACLDEVVGRAEDRVTTLDDPPAVVAPSRATVPWWSPQRGRLRRHAAARPRAVEIGIGRPRSMRPGRRSGSRSTGRISSAGSAGTRDASDAWAGVAAGPGRTAIVAWIELAKLREHRLRRSGRRARGHAPRARRRRAPTSARPCRSRRSRRTCAVGSRGYGVGWLPVEGGSNRARQRLERRAIERRRPVEHDRVDAGVVVSPQFGDDRRHRTRERGVRGHLAGRGGGHRLALEDVGQDLDGRRPRRADAGRREACRPLDRLGRATDRPTVLVEDAVPPAERLGVVLVGIPDVGVFGDDPERPLLPAPTDRDRQPRLDRRWVVPRVDRAEPGACMGHGRPVEQPAADRRRVAQPIETPADRREFEAEGLVLQLEPPRAQAEDGAAAGRMVQGGRHLDEHARVPIRSTRDEAPHPRLTGDPRPSEQGRPALEDGAAAIDRPTGRLGQEVVVAPQFVEPELVDLAPDRHEFGPGHVLTPDLEPEAQPSGRHRQASATDSTAPLRADRSAASSTRSPRTESAGSTGRSPSPRIASLSRE